MEPVFVDPNSEFDNEFILVQISNHKVSYRDHQVILVSDTIKNILSCLMFKIY